MSCVREMLSKCHGISYIGKRRQNFKQSVHCELEQVQRIYLLTTPCHHHMTCTQNASTVCSLYSQSVRKQRKCAEIHSVLVPLPVIFLCVPNSIFLCVPNAIKTVPTTGPSNRYSIYVSPLSTFKKDMHVTGHSIVKRRN